MLQFWKFLPMFYLTCFCIFWEFCTWVLYLHNFHYLLFPMEYIHTYIYPFIVVHMYMCWGLFRVGDLGLDNLSGILSQKKTDYCSLSSHWLHTCCVGHCEIQGWDLVKFLLSTWAHSLLLSLCRSCLGNHIVEIPWVQLLHHF